MKRLISCLAFVYLVTTISVHCYRLPTSVVPQHYTVKILTELDNDFHFNGDVLIKIDCLEPTTNITLHSKNLDIPKESVSLKTSDNGEVKINNVRHDDENDFLIISLESPLAKGSQYSLFMKFSGILSEGLAGYYRSSYVDRTTGIKKWVAVTQFESTDARRAFPCFDEPGMKAVFGMSLGHRNNYTSISNMRIKSVEKIADKPDWVIDHYEDTVKMSTYLVAFVVSEFAYKISEHDNSGHWKTGFTNTAYDDTENIRVSRSGGKCRTIKRSLASESRKTPVMFRTWARRDALNQVDYAAENGPKYLKFYEEFFNVSYPLPKQDMIALPDFNAGAMENWGLITYRETALLYDPKASSVTSKHRVAEVIAHELAHQWFGNLVTMKWWTDLWLNEGFATYMESLAVDHVNPKWNSLPEEATDYLLSVFSLDALNSSHPISIPIGHPNEISQIFDTISYRKGASILRMMNLFLGDSVFKKGVSNYLNKYAYGNAEQDNLWECLTEEAHKQNVLEKSLTVKEIMDTWTLQTGHPVVFAVRDYDKEEVTLTQKRFFTDTSLDNGSDKSCWWVPLSFTTSEEKDFNTTMAKDWLKCGEEKVLCSEKKDEWYMVNIKLAGLYRVNYDIRNWQALTRVLVEGNHKDIAVLNRVQLIVDSLDLAATGHVNYSVPLNLLRYLEKETEYLPWSTALSASGYLNRRLLKTPAYGAFKKYIKQLLTPIYEKIGGFDMSKLGNTDEIYLIKFKIKITSASCSHDIGSCRKDAQELFSKWKGTSNPDSNNPIPKDLRGVVYCVALKDGDEDDWEFLWKRYVNSNVAAEKAAMMSSLGCTSKLWLLNRYLEWSITDGTEIRRQDSFYAFGAVANNEVGYYLAKEFLKNRLEDVYSYHGAKSGRMTRYFSGIAPHMMSTSELNEFVEIAHRNETVFNESKLGIHQAMETIRINIQWHKNYYQDVKNLLENLVKK